MNACSQKFESKEFWNANPCGTSASWKKAQEIRFQHTDPFLKPILNSDIFKKGNVLEVGCGQGLDAAEIIQNCRFYVGFDMSNNSVRIAKSEVFELSNDETGCFLVGDAELMPFPDNSFDVVYSYGVLHHTLGFERAISEISRVLKPDGTLLLMLYRSYTPLWLILRLVRGLLRIPLIGTRIKHRALNSSREKLKSSDSISGTAMLELIGCPVINTYTIYRLRRCFEQRLLITQYECFRVGFDQILRILPVGCRFLWPQFLMNRLEELLRPLFGFYLLVTAKVDHK